jgi:hypothetical protein
MMYIHDAEDTIQQEYSPMALVGVEIAVEGENTQLQLTGGLNLPASGQNEVDLSLLFKVYPWNS